jgi:23S rRNA (cytidine1920-2'-O)/16S rRNA (cytidine1409-2'-O)-methyltransferase
MAKIRLDALLADRGLFPSREQARRAVLAGLVSVNGTVKDKPGASVDESLDAISIKPVKRFVSRGADKLARALEIFEVDLAGTVVLDAGASTGGFTDLALAEGAIRVMAVDVGYGQLAWKLRCDDRVDVFERTNIKDLKPGDLPAPADVVTADLSFISLINVADVLIRLANESADFIFLIKPQFEAGKGRVGKGGIIRDKAHHAEILTKVTDGLEKKGLTIRGLTYSPITGADGNIEFLGWFKKEKSRKSTKSTKSRESTTSTESTKERSEQKHCTPRTHRNPCTPDLIDRVVNEAHEALKRIR